MEKKISFGFSKISKKPNLLPNKIETKDDKKGIELIKCLEGQTIQLVEKKEEEAPLVIPLKEGGKTSAALLSLRTRQAVLNGEEISNTEVESPSLPALEINANGIEDIEKRAARELLAEVSKEDQNDTTGPALVLPVKAEDLPLDGAKESTLDDYESIPITQFGKAMLRGMGWKDQPKKKGAPVEEVPLLRPKGMGLGADKALKAKALLVPPEANEVLEIKKGACVLVLGGKHKDLYGQVEGLDDHAGRVIVKMALGGTKESFNEFMVQPVSKKEYSQYSKCINSAKYDEYKRMENEYGQIVKKEEKVKNENDYHDDDQRMEETVQRTHNNAKYDDKTKISLARINTTDQQRDYGSRKNERRSRSRDRRDKECDKYSSSRSKYSRRTPSPRRSNSNDSASSLDSNSYRNKHKKSSKSKKSKKSKDRKHERRHSSESSSENERRHKKKTKKSKRRRSRSRSKTRR